MSHSLQAESPGTVLVAATVAASGFESPQSLPLHVAAVATGTVHVAAAAAATVARVPASSVPLPAEVSGTVPVAATVDDDNARFKQARV